jgi:hypothetical protein
MANITQNGYVPAVFEDGILKIASAMTTNVQQVTDYLGNGSTLYLSSLEVSLNRGILRNFVPVYQTGGSLIVNGSNSDQLNTSVYGLTGAVTIVFNALFDGFSMSFIQLDTNQPTFSATGGNTLVNRQGHTKPAGQYAMVSVFYHTGVVYFGGDTA